MKRTTLLIFLGLGTLVSSKGLAQGSFLEADYQTFGRKDPASLGSVFSSLSTNTIFLNPAQVAFANDNRINIGLGISGIGNGRFISWMAPNLAISSSNQNSDRSDLSGRSHEKKLLHFAFGISSQDLGYSGKNQTFGLGLAIKRQSDRLTPGFDGELQGGSAVSVDLGLLYKWNRFELEMILVDVNTPQLSDSEVSYGRGFVVGSRFTTLAGLTIALQGVGGNGYAGSDFGLSFGAEQSFMDQRLVARLQLTSFFSGSEAAMQNISANIGYRLDPQHELVSFLKDLEFSYALSFLALPNNVGTHMVVVTKYF